MTAPYAWARVDDAGAAERWVFARVESGAWLDPLAYVTRLPSGWHWQARGVRKGALREGEVPTRSLAKRAAIEAVLGVVEMRVV